MAPFDRRANRLAVVLRLVLLATAVALVAGCAANLPQDTLRPTTEYGSSIDWLFNDILAWEIGIFVVVEAMLLIAVFRFRRSRRDRDPEQVHGHTGLEIAWTLVPAIILVFIGVPTVATIFRTQARPPANSLTIEVTGHQWWWEFRYPAQGVITANELHLPLGRPIHLVLSSADVIHSFWVPRLGGKRDVIPAHTNHIWFTPQVAGRFPGQCAEFCGDSHANMRLLAIVEPPSAFAAWAAAERDTAARQPPPGDTLAVAGAHLFQEPQNLCTTCHTVQGVSVGVVGPNLSHVASRSSIAGGMLPNTQDNLVRWLDNPPAVKPGSRMPRVGLTPESARAIAAYLRTLR